MTNQQTGHNNLEEGNEGTLSIPNSLEAIRERCLYAENEKKTLLYLCGKEVFFCLYKVSNPYSSQRNTAPFSLAGSAPL